MLSEAYFLNKSVPKKVVLLNDHCLVRQQTIPFIGPHPGLLFPRNLQERD